MRSVELAEIKKRAEIICARVVESLQSELEALHTRNAAAGRLRSGATVKESARIARKSIRLYFSELEQFIRSRPDNRPEFDANIIDAVSTSTAGLIASINKGLLKTATLVGDASLVSAISPEVTAELSSSQDTFRSNIRAYWASKAVASERTRTENVLIGIEVICIIASAILAGMWVQDPKGLYEPYLQLFGICFLAADIYRRYAKRHST